jgi:hypothetical protein
MGYQMDPIVEGLKELGNWDGIGGAITALKAPADQGGFDFNPFNQDDDEFGVVGEIQNNLILVGNLVHEVVLGVESLAAATDGLNTSEAKLEAASSIVANALKAALPSYLFFLKFALQPVVRHFITAAVNGLNARLGNDWLNQEQGGGELVDVRPEDTLP